MEPVILSERRNPNTPSPALAPATEVREVIMRVLWFLCLLPLAIVGNTTARACSPFVPQAATFEPASATAPAPLPRAPEVRVEAQIRGGDSSRTDSCWDLGRIVLSVALDPDAHAYQFQLAGGLLPFDLPDPPVFSYERDGRMHFQLAWLEAVPGPALDFTLRVTAFARDGTAGGSATVRVQSPALPGAASSR